MLTDEELTTRLSAAFHESVPELTYAGRVPHVHRSHTGVLATSALAAAAALVLTPAALQRGDDRPSSSVPSATAGTRHLTVHQVVHRLDIAGLHLSAASVHGNPGQMYLAAGGGLAVPPDAEKVDVGLPVDVYFVDHPASGEPQVYISYQACPDTIEGCNGGPPPTYVYGILAPGWTRQQLMEFLQHPNQTDREAK